MTDTMVDEVDLEEYAKAGKPVPAARHYKLHVGYDCATVSVALLIPPGYPDTQIDMVYFFPGLTNGRPINAVSAHALDGKTWQRWSRHRTAQNPWRPGLDGVGTHLGCV